MKGIIFSSTQLRMMCSGWATSDELPLPPLGLVPGGWCFGVAAFESCFYSARRGQGKLELSECSTTWAGGGRRPALARCEWKGLRARENICNLCVFLSDLRWFFPAIDVEDKDLLHIFHVACWACFWFSCLAPCTSFGFPFSVLIVPQEFLHVQLP